MERSHAFYGSFLIDESASWTSNLMPSNIRFILPELAWAETNNIE